MAERDVLDLSRLIYRHATDLSDMLRKLDQAEIEAQLRISNLKTETEKASAALQRELDLVTQTTDRRRALRDEIVGLEKQRDELAVEVDALEARRDSAREAMREMLSKSAEENTA